MDASSFPTKSRRRWTQFSLRFLLIGVLAAALAAWWFRPGIVRATFTLEGVEPIQEEYSGKSDLHAQIRMTNAGPDSIWLDDVRSFSWRWDGQRVDSSGGGGVRSAFDSVRIQLQPGESTVFSVPLADDAIAIQLGVLLSDRPGSKGREFWSQKFTIPDE